MPGSRPKLRAKKAPESPLFLGVDGGGTATRAALADSTGRILGVCEADSSNLNHHEPAAARANLERALTGACHGPIPKSVACIFLGMSGVSVDADRLRVTAMVRAIPGVAPGMQVVVENDTVAALAGGLGGKPGAVLIAGTGSVCLARNGDAKSFMCGGWGALADDVGSAGWVGLRALEAAVRCEDGRIGPTVLRDIVFQRLGLRTPREFIHRVHNEPLTRDAIAALARDVVQAMLDGDAVAMEILNNAAAGLAALVRSAAAHCFGEAGAFELVMAGGLAASGPPFTPLLAAAVRRVVPNVKIVRPRMAPVYGAVEEARRMGAAPRASRMISAINPPTGGGNSP